VNYFKDGLYITKYGTKIRYLLSKKYSYLLLERKYRRYDRFIIEGSISIHWYYKSHEIHCHGSIDEFERLIKLRVLA